MRQLDTRPYTSRLQKGGALLDDMRLLVRAWRNGSAREIEPREILGVVLGKKTRARAEDTYRRAFAPRFLHGVPPVAWKLIRPLEDREAPLELVRPVYYWITARNEPLLYEFVTAELVCLSKQGDPQVRIDETAGWITTRLAERGQKWTPTVTVKVARGLLAALRDFGILEGAAKKRISPAYLPVEAFAYIAFCLHSMGMSGAALIGHPDWRLFLMNPPAVEALFVEANQRHLLRFEAAGKIYRIEFPVATMEEYSDVVAGKEL